MKWKSSRCKTSFISVNSRSSKVSIVLWDTDLGSILIVSFASTFLRTPNVLWGNVLPAIIRFQKARIKWMLCSKPYLVRTSMGSSRIVELHLFNLPALPEVLLITGSLSEITRKVRIVEGIVFLCSPGRIVTGIPIKTSLQYQHRIILFQ